MKLYRILFSAIIMAGFSIYAQCTADAGTVTVTLDGVDYPGGSDIILCWDQSSDNCIDIVSNNDYVLPPDAVHPTNDPAELMYALYFCEATPGVEPDLDPCFTGLFWTGQDYSNCNDAANNLPDIIESITGIYSADFYFYPITMDDGDNESPPQGNGMMNYDQDLDGCWDMALDQQVLITYLQPLGAVATPVCSNGTVSITIGGGYPEQFVADYTAVNTGSGSISSTAITSTGNGDSVTFVISGLLNGDNWSVSLGGSYDCDPVVLSGSYTACICNADAGTVTATLDGVDYPGGSNIVLCFDQATDNCIDIVSNNDYVLPPDAVHPTNDPAELMYALYFCEATPGVEPDLDPCFTGLFWTGQDYSNCNDAANNLPDIIESITGVYSENFHFYPITMDDGDNESPPQGNGVMSYDQDGDGCFDMALDQEIIITYLKPIGGVATPDCNNGSVTINVAGGYPEMFAADYVLTNNGSGTPNLSNITSTGNGDSVTFVITGLNDGDNWNVTIGGSYDCTPLTLSGSFVSCVCNADIGTFNVVGNSLVAGQYYICNNEGASFDIVSNNDFVLPPSPDVPGLGYAIYDCPPSTTDIDNDPCWTGFYWTGQDVTIDDAMFDFFGNDNLYIVPITMDDIQTTAGSGANDDLGHDIDGDGCYALDLGTVFNVVRLNPIQLTATEDCSDGTVDFVVAGGMAEYNGKNYTFSNVLPVTASLSAAVTHNGTITMSGLNNGDSYSFDVTDSLGCTYTYSGGPYTDCSCVTDIGTFNVPSNAPVNGRYYICNNEGNSFSINSNNDYTLPSSPDVPGLGYAIFSCPPSTTDIDNDPCWTGFYWTGQNITINDAQFDFFGFEELFMVPITMDDIQTTAGSGADDNLGHDIDGDACYALDLGTVFNVVRLNPIQVVAAENCNDSTVSFVITGGISEVNDSAYSITNVLPASASISAAPAHGGTFVMSGLQNGQSYSFDVTDSLGCTYSYSGGPYYANFVSAGVNRTICSDSSLTLTAQSYDGTVSWNNGVTDGVGFVPTVAGEYIVTADNGGCLAKDTMVLTINLSPTFEAGVDQAICPGEMVTLTASNPDNANISWDHGMVDGVAANVSTTTMFHLTGDLNGCPGLMDSVEVVVNEIPSFTITNVTDPSCDNNDGSFDLNITGTPTFTVSLNSVVANSAAGNTTTMNALSAGTYTILVSNGFCSPGTQEVTLSLPPTPTGDLIITNENCIAQDGVIEVNMTSGAAPYNYSLNGDPGVANPVFGNLTTGNYDLTITDANNCILVLNGYLGTNDNLVADFDMSAYEGNAPLEVSFVNNTQDGSQFLWDFNNGNTSSLEQPNNEVFNEGTYTITLYASNAYGCQDSTSIDLWVYSNFVLNIPNIFTPNGDGENDLFYVEGEGIAEINCVIYNRWGNKIISFDPIQNAWNGKNNNGSELNEEVYYYMIIAKDFKGEVHEFNGNVTIMR